MASILKHTAKTRKIYAARATKNYFYALNLGHLNLQNYVTML